MFLSIVTVLSSCFPLHSVSGQCEPVCAQGCVNGTCVSPGVCQCHFGFVGDNCSSQCSCNKHSNCAGVSKPDVCLECHNNTIVSAYSKTHAHTVNTAFFPRTLVMIYFYISFQGKHCEKCKPLFVGSAKGGGTCRPCREFCRGNSAVCLSGDEHKKALENPQRFPLDPNSVSVCHPCGLVLIIRMCLLLYVLEGSIMSFCLFIRFRGGCLRVPQKSRPCV